ncbi:hypothetical protein ACVRWQ_06025 [Streptococcus phocae subsp. salmonis]|uniref:hypothetical protein n=1 Tax=Streptococcus phocae TaxID=119224 RepID=UPI000531870E|nr:hypothetical protein [Streptococcus phocae]KGR72894.1 hypothetical protein NX86_03980 [Streptococcus phocae subsp. salmonis]QBX27846.1 hypothetical protein Javan420_0046 [Streptococcus phage Javan420]
MKYRKKPVEVEAVQWTGKNEFEVSRFVGPGMFFNDLREPVIETLEGNMRTSKGDYIIKGVNGEFYPCKPDIFEQTYESI